MTNKDDVQTKDNLIQIPLDVWNDLRNQTLEYTQKEVDRALQQDQERQAIQEGEPTSEFLTFEDGKVKYDHVGQAKEIIRELKIMHNKFGLFYFNKKTGLWCSDTIPVVKKLIHQKLGKYHNIKRQSETINSISSCYDENCLTLPFDQNINLIGFKNGVYDLDTKRLRPYRPTDYLTTAAVHNFNENAKNPLTERYLTKLLGDKKQFFLEWIGYSFYRSYKFQYLIILKGNGHNGKSVLINWYTHLIGGRNVSNVPLKDLQENRFAKAILHKKYSNVFADISDDYFRYAEMLKTLTGDDTIDCDVKNQASVNFKNHAKLMFSANTLPSFRDKTDGLVRRFIILPMVAKMEVAKKDFMQVLLTDEEIEGTIYAAIKAFEQVLERKSFSITDDMNQAKTEWLDNMDYVRSFVEEECEMGIDKSIGTHRLFYQYQQFCKDADVSSMGKNKFFEHLCLLFPNVTRTRGEMIDGKKPLIFKGIGLII